MRNRFFALMLCGGLVILFAGCAGQKAATATESKAAETQKTAAPKSAANLDFGPWAPGTSPREVGKRVAENFLSRPHSNFGRPGQPPYITYPESCAWYGALEFARLSGDGDLREKLIQRFEPLLSGDEQKLVPEPNHVDLSVFGIVPCEIAILNNDGRCLEMARVIANAQWDKPTTTTTPEMQAAMDQGLTWQTRYWIDDMFMITALQVQAWRATNEKIHLDRAATEMAVYLDKLQQPNGLFYHAPDVPFFWGRGDGWVASGMTELLRDLTPDHPQYERIMAGYKKMMAALLKYQDANGMWHQLIDKPDAWPESSSTAMFTYAMITGVKNGWLEGDEYKTAAKKGWLGVISYLNDKAEVREICEGTNKKNDMQYYLDRQRRVGDFHGQAPILWCAAALLR